MKELKKNATLLNTSKIKYKNRKKGGKVDILSTHIHERSISCVVSDTSIKS